MKGIGLRVLLLHLPQGADVRRCVLSTPRLKKNFNARVPLSIVRGCMPKTELGELSCPPSGNARQRGLCLGSTQVQSAPTRMPGSSHTNHNKHKHNLRTHLPTSNMSPRPKRLVSMSPSSGRGPLRRAHSSLLAPESILAFERRET